MAKSSTTFRKGQSGNPAGRRLGSRNAATRALDELLDGEGEKIVRKAVEMAIGGDATAMRLCLDRIMPPRRERAIEIALPEITTPADAVQASAAIVEAVAAGAITLSEAAELSRLVANVATAISTNDLAERIAKLEQAQGR